LESRPSRALHFNTVRAQNLCSQASRSIEELLTRDASSGGCAWNWYNADRPNASRDQRDSRAAGGEKESSALTNEYHHILLRQTPSFTLWLVV
jgi:hypothetical protein